MIAGRRLPISELGQASALLALLPLAATIGTLGLDAAIARNFATSPDQRRLLIRAFRLAVLGALIAGAFTGAIRHGDQPLVAIIAVASIAASLLASQMLSAAAIVASRRAPLLLIETLFAGTVKITLVASVPATELGLILAAVGGIAASSLTSLVVLRWLVRPTAMWPGQSEPISQYATSNWIASSFSLLPFATLPMVVLLRAGAEAAAFVAVAALLSPLLRLIPSTVIRSFFAEVASGTQQLVPLAKRTARLGFSLTALAALMLAATAPLFLSLFGERYVTGSSTLIWFLAAAATVSVANYLGDAILNLKRDHRAFMATNIAGTCGLMAAITLGAGHGVTGLGVAWVVGELMYATISWLTIRARHAGPRPV